MSAKTYLQEFPRRRFDSLFLMNILCSLAGYFPLIVASDLNNGFCDLLECVVVADHKNLFE